jgi:hypothetical protein
MISIKLCQVGIEQVQRSAQRRNSAVSLEEVKNFEEFCKTSAWRVLSQCADRQGRELFEFFNLKKNPQKDLHRVVEHPERLSHRFLERRIARWASYFLHLKEKR